MKVKNGWLISAKRVMSPNFTPRPENQSVSLLVIHNISLPPEQFGTPYIEQFFQNRLAYDDHPYFEHLQGVEVSAHFLIKRAGEIVQFVSCDDRAWHAGASEYCGVENCNDFSIGIELEGSDDIPYTQQQYVQLSTLTTAIQNAYPELTSDRITGHEHIAPGRKTDPGPSFNWDHYRNNLS